MVHILMSNRIKFISLDQLMLLNTTPQSTLYVQVSVFCVPFNAITVQKLLFKVVSSNANKVIVC